MGANRNFLSGSHQLSSERRAAVERILSAALRAVDPEQAVRHSLRLTPSGLEAAGQIYDLHRFKRVRVVGAGKAVYAMARGLWEVLGNRLDGGLLIAKHLEENNGGLPETIRVVQGNHPVPGPGSLAAAQDLAGFLSQGEEDDLVICLISGGGSALMTLPGEVELAEVQELTRLLLASGATIGEINTLRKHLDQIKGGGLARMASTGAHMRLITLILSDVVGSPLDVIASGPTVPDSSTYEQALEILRKYSLVQQAPAPVLRVLEAGQRGELPETAKAEDPVFERVQNVLVGSNIQAAEAGLEQARQEGFAALLLTSYLQGEASQVGGVLASILKQVDASGHPLARPACLVAGGETTVTLRGKGMGGRNQELALGAALALDGTADVALVTLGTDGEDGPTDAAGALVTGTSLAQSREMGLSAQEALNNNDSYPFFKALGDLVMTGPTGTNVNDLVFLLAF